MTDGLIRFFFEFCDNLQIGPDWWESLGDHKRMALVDRMTASADHKLARRLGCIAEDAIEFDNWPISGSRSVGF